MVPGSRPVPEKELSKMVKPYTWFIFPYDIQAKCGE